MLEQLEQILEAVLMASEKPMSIKALLSLFNEEEGVEAESLRAALAAIQAHYLGRGIELKETGAGFRFQVPQAYAPWVQRLWALRPQRYSRALMETLALIAYRQPLTRAEIEAVRGVAVSTHIMKTLLEREWIKIVGHKDVPGKPALFATTKDFLAHFNLKHLKDLPDLPACTDLDNINLDGIADSPVLPEDEDRSEPSKVSSEQEALA